MTLTERILEWLREAKAADPDRWYGVDEIHAAVDSAHDPCTRSEVAQAMPSVMRRAAEEAGLEATGGELRARLRP